MPTPTIRWSGVFPAVTTQFREDFSLDLDATGRVIEGLLADGVSGLIIAGTVGENCSLSKAEKLVFARGFAARVGALNAQVLSHLAPCLGNAEVQAALQTLNKVGR